MARGSGRAGGNGAAPGGEVLVRLDLPVATLGLTAPPRKATLQAMSTTRGMVLLVTLPGVPSEDAQRWQESLGFGPVLQGLGHRLHRIEVTQPRPVWDAVLEATQYHHVVAHPGGVATLTLRGPRRSVHHLVEEVLRTPARDARVRSVHVSSEPAGLLTARQREGLLAAHRAGYYRVPRPVNLLRLARSLGISSPALSELLRRAERAIIDAYVSGRLTPSEAGLREPAEPGAAPDGPPRSETRARGAARPGRRRR